MFASILEILTMLPGWERLFLPVLCRDKLGRDCS